jgi:hypothetical protein
MAVTSRTATILARMNEAPGDEFAGRREDPSCTRQFRIVQAAPVDPMKNMSAEERRAGRSRDPTYATQPD